jgi:hypothetical protein
VCESLGLLPHSSPHGKSEEREKKKKRTFYFYFIIKESDITLIFNELFSELASVGDFGDISEI